MRNLIISFGALLLLCSCSNLYEVSKLQNGYETFAKENPNSTEALIANNVPIYVQENTIPYDYEIVAYGTYNPVIRIPLIATGRKRIENKLYLKAANKVLKLNADAALISVVSTSGYYKIIKFKDGPHTPSIKEMKSTVKAQDREERQQKIDNVKDKVGNTAEGVKNLFKKKDTDN